jgi:hypothetical protein
MESHIKARWRFVVRRKSGKKRPAEVVLPIREFKSEWPQKPVHLFTQEPTFEGGKITGRSGALVARSQLVHPAR